MIRSFVAVALPETLQARLGEVSKQLKSLDLHASFPRTEAMHLTLKFLGDIREEQVNDISAALTRAAEGIPAFEVSIRKLGCFPHAANPRVAWAGVELAPGLRNLARNTEAELSNLGFTPEQRPFSPHLTLARIKSRQNIARLSRLIETEGAGLDLGSFPVSEFFLYKSTLLPTGARYEKLARFPLEKA